MSLSRLDAHGDRLLLSQFHREHRETFPRTISPFFLVVPDGGLLMTDGLGRRSRFCILL